MGLKSYLVTVSNMASDQMESRWQINLPPEVALEPSLTVRQLEMPITYWGH